jgi:hypothetical protein
MITVHYVLFVQYADDPPRLKVYGTLDEAKDFLDGLALQMFDRAQRELFRARIYRCRSDDWGTEVSKGYDGQQPNA